MECDTLIYFNVTGFADLIISVSLWESREWKRSKNMIPLPLVFARLLANIWFVDQVWAQDSWILSKFFFCVLMDQDKVEVHKLAKRGQYPAILTDKAWSMNDLLFGLRGNFSSRTRQVIPSGQDGVGSQSQCMIWFILSALGANHILQ